MRKSKIIGMNAYLKQVEKDVTQYWVTEQTNRLIVYAQKTIGEIGSKISSYHSKNNMDDTGNLLDSLCWGVSYEGKLIESGFYRNAKATDPSWLHANSIVEFKGTSGQFKDKWIKASAAEEVNGRALAESYIHKYGNINGKGWKVFFAILAPYWGYWEKGFTMVHGLSTNGTFYGASFRQFAVMTQFYDQAKRDLKPAKTRFRVSVAKYASKSLHSRAKKNFYG